MAKPWDSHRFTVLRCYSACYIQCWPTSLVLPHEALIGISFISHGSPMGLPRAFHRSPMGLPWDSHDGTPIRPTKVANWTPLGLRCSPIGLPLLLLLHYFTALLMHYYCTNFCTTTALLLDNTWYCITNNTSLLHYYCTTTTLYYSILLRQHQSFKGSIGLDEASSLSRGGSPGIRTALSALSAQRLSGKV